MQAIAMADELYELIEQALTLELEEAERIFLLRQALDTIIRELTLNEPYVFSDNAARWAYVQTKFQIPDDLVWQVDGFRRLTRPNAPAPSQNEIYAGANALSQLVQHLSSTAVPATLSQLCGGQVYPPLKTPALGRLDYLHGCVLDPPELKTDSQGRPYLRLRCRVEEPAGMGVVTVLLQEPWGKTPIWQNAMLRATDLDVIGSGGTATAYAATGKSFVVVEPDLLFPATDIAECVQFRGLNPYIALLSRLQRSPASESAVAGSIVNDLFDDLLQNPNANFSTCFARSCRKNAFKLAALGGNAVIQRVRAQVEPQFHNLQRLLRSIGASPIYIEPTIVAPAYGIQGRLDTLTQTRTGDALLELKSGKSPDNGVWANNEAQARCYQLLLETV